MGDGRWERGRWEKHYLVNSKDIMKFPLPFPLSLSDIPPPLEKLMLKHIYLKSPLRIKIDDLETSCF